jgi:hypothetical protein
MENVPPCSIPRAALRLIVDDEDEGEGHLEVSEGRLSEMREVCEAGPSSSSVQRPIGPQRAIRGKKHFDPTFGMRRVLGSRSNRAARMGYTPSRGGCSSADLE